MIDAITDLCWQFEERGRLLILLCTKWVVSLNVDNLAAPAGLRNVHQVAILGQARAGGVVFSVNRGIHGTLR